MTTDSKIRCYVPPDELHVTSHTLFAAAALQGILANSDIRHDVEKSTSMAERYADRMVERERER